MNIGELAKRTGLTHSRIRFYESIGLLQTVDRKANGYRTYPADAVSVLDMITTAQKAGFSLDEIRALMPGASDTWKHGELMDALRGKVADIEALEKRLAESKAQLVAVITFCVRPYIAPALAAISGLSSATNDCACLSYCDHAAHSCSSVMRSQRSCCTSQACAPLRPSLPERSVTCNSTQRSFGAPSSLR